MSSASRSALPGGSPSSPAEELGHLLRGAARVAAPSAAAGASRASAAEGWLGSGSARAPGDGRAAAPPSRLRLGRRVLAAPRRALPRAPPRLRLGRFSCGGAGAAFRRRDHRPLLRPRPEDLLGLPPGSAAGGRAGTRRATRRSARPVNSTTATRIHATPITRTIARDAGRRGRHRWRAGRERAPRARSEDRAGPEHEASLAGRSRLRSSTGWPWARVARAGRGRR